MATLQGHDWPGNVRELRNAVERAAIFCRGATVRPELQPDHPGVDTSVQAAIPFYGVYDFLVRYNQHPNQEVYQRFLSGKVMRTRDILVTWASLPALRR